MSASSIIKNISFKILSLIINKDLICTGNSYFLIFFYEGGSFKYKLFIWCFLEVFKIYQSLCTNSYLKNRENEAK